MQRRFVACLCWPLACAFFDSGEGGPNGGGSSDPAEAMQKSVGLPGETNSLKNPAVDESIVLQGDPNAPPSPVYPGSSFMVGIPFDAPNGDIVGAGIQFGSQSSIRVVSVPDVQGQTSGTLVFQVQVPPSICDNLSEICHEIICNEFAVTKAGTISRANIQSIALVCGRCDEPSCQKLLQPCPSIGGGWSGTCDSYGGFDVSGSFTMDIDDSGAVTGSYTGTDSGEISGTLGEDGSFSASASGSAGGNCMWSGKISGEGEERTAQGSWSCPELECSGTWSGISLR